MRDALYERDVAHTKSGPVAIDARSSNRKTWTAILKAILKARHKLTFKIVRTFWHQVMRQGVTPTSPEAREKDLFSGAGWGPSALGKDASRAAEGVGGALKIPISGEPRVRTALRLWRSRSPSQAAELLRESIKTSKNDAEPSFTYAQLLWAQGRLKESEAVLRMAIDIDPAHAKSYISLARILVARGELDEAQILSRRYANLRPDDCSIAASLDEEIWEHRLVRYHAGEEPFTITPLWVATHQNHIGLRPDANAPQ